MREATTIRTALASDAPGIAALHAASWRRTYADVLSEAYLAGPVEEDRRAAWAARLNDTSPSPRVWVAEAESGGLLGFACWYVDDDPQWGHLLDNLHVDAAAQGHRIGARLLCTGARHCLDTSPGTGLYLWVLAGNDRATAFYRHHGGVESGTGWWAAPDGQRHEERRMVWSSLAAKRLAARVPG